MSYFIKNRKDIEYIISEESLQYFAFNFINSESKELTIIWNEFIINRASNISKLINDHLYYLISQKSNTSKYDLLHLIYINSKKMCHFLKDLKNENSNLIDTKSNCFNFTLQQYQNLNDKYKKYYKIRVFMLKNYLNEDVLSYILDFFY